MLPDDLMDVMPVPAVGSIGKWRKVSKATSRPIDPRTEKQLHDWRVRLEVGDDKAAEDVLDELQWDRVFDDLDADELAIYSKAHNILERGDRSGNYQGSGVQEAVDKAAKSYRRKQETLAKKNGAKKSYDDEE
jgi:hypothetical protein